MVVLIPVFNDWDAAGMLVQKLDQELCDVAERNAICVVVINDGSTEPVPTSFAAIRGRAISRIAVLGLRCNLGHQRALCVGLAYVEANLPCRAVVVMDGDGEDAPADVPKLLEKFEQEGGRKIVFAERSRRTENFGFRLCYGLYKVIHFLATGIRVRVGNFSVIPVSLLSRLVVVSDLWNHYAAAVFKARLPMVTLPTPRANRLVGRSRMSFVSLVIHGLSAISVFRDRVGVRLLAILSVLVLADLTALGTVVALRFATSMAVAGWATYTCGLLLVMLIQMLMFGAMFVFLVLGARDNATCLPLRDYIYFVEELDEIFSRSTMCSTDLDIRSVPSPGTEVAK